jgi:hypothetical protein
MDPGTIVGDAFAAMVVADFQRYAEIVKRSSIVVDF